MRFREIYLSGSHFITGVSYPHLSHLLSNLDEVRYEISLIILFSIFLKIVTEKVVLFLRSLMKLHFRVYRVIYSARCALVKSV